MTRQNTSVADFIDQIRSIAPEFLDLLTADNLEQWNAAIALMVEQALDHLEKNKKLFASLDEEGLSAAVVAKLSVPGIMVTQEAQSNGHVDITIEGTWSTPIKRSLCEAKIHRGPKYHIKGLHQLLSRYSTGREGLGFVLVYFRCKGIAQKIEKIRMEMDDKRPESQVGPTANRPQKWSFSSTHSHSCGEQLEVGHVGCNLYVG